MGRPGSSANGTTGFIGSRRQEAERHLHDALSEPAAVAVEAIARAEGGGLHVAYVAAEAPAGAVLHLAVVERSTAQQVRRGENRGRRLAHTNVVRVLRTFEAGRGTTALPLPEGFAPADVRVAAWVQQGEVGPVLGVAWAGG